MSQINRRFTKKQFEIAENVKTLTDGYEVSNAVKHRTELQGPEKNFFLIQYVCLSIYTSCHISSLFFFAGTRKFSI